MPKIIDNTIGKHPNSKAIILIDDEPRVPWQVIHSVSYARKLVQTAIEKGQTRGEVYRIIPVDSDLSEEDKKRLKKLRERKKDGS